MSAALALAKVTRTMATCSDCTLPCSAWMRSSACWRSSKVRWARASWVRVSTAERRRAWALAPIWGGGGSPWVPGAAPAWVVSQVWASSSPWTSAWARATSSWALRMRSATALSQPVAMRRSRVCTFTSPMRTLRSLRTCRLRGSSWAGRQAKTACVLPAGRCKTRSTEATPG